MKNMNIYYDEEGDFLEISVDNSKQGYSEEIEPGIFLRKEEKTGKVLGIGVLGFKKRAKSLNEIVLNLPIHLDLSYAEEIAD